MTTMVKQMNSMQRVHFRHLLKNCRLYNFVEKFYGQCVNLIFLMLSCFSRVLLFATLWTVAHQVPLPWDSPGQNIEEGGHVLLQRIFPTQGMKPHLLSPCICRQVLYHRHHHASIISLTSNLHKCYS